MKYCSTRDASLRVSSAHAIRCGISSDGGLFLPCDCPTLSLSEILNLENESYYVRAAKILSLFLTDYPYDKLLNFTKHVYTTDRFSSPCIAPVVSLNDNTHVLELFHGPTAAFKDMALQMLPLLLTEAMRIEGIKENILILTATSGDTGSAAMTGFSDVDGTKICVFYPDGGTSLLQRLQMTTQAGMNVTACAVQGNFDDAQRGVKALFTDKTLNALLSDHNYLFSSANSINFGRLAPQIVYYFSGYLDLIKAGKIKPGEYIDICVPTGNFGNILSARYAKEMGLPVGKLICASNKNKVLYDFIRTGIYDKRRQFYRTGSPSMDILVSSNLERLLFLLSGKDDNLTADYMRALNSDGVYPVSDSIKNAIEKEFYACWADEEQTAQAIRDTFAKYSYLADTHTAVGLSAIDQYRKETGSTSPILLASTASPYKFPGTVLKALGENVPSDEFSMLNQLFTVSGCMIPSCLSSLKTKPERFTGSIAKDKMGDLITSIL